MKEKSVPKEKFDRVEVGKKIKQLRLAKEQTVQDLSEDSSVSAGYLSEVERGLSDISVDKLMKIAGGLGVELDTLLGDETKPIGCHETIAIPAALSEAAEQLNLSHRATLALLQGQRSLTARRSQSERAEWDVSEWIRFYKQVKDYLPEC